MTVKWTDLQNQLGAQLTESLQGLVEGSAQDIQLFANAIASELVLATAAGDKAALRELEAQLLVIAEINRVRVAKEKEGFVLKLVGVALNAATSGLLAAGAKL